MSKKNKSRGGVTPKTDRDEALVSYDSKLLLDTRKAIQLSGIADLSEEEIKSMPTPAAFVATLKLRGLTTLAKQKLRSKENYRPEEQLALIKELELVERRNREDHAHHRAILDEARKSDNASEAMIALLDGDFITGEDDEVEIELMLTCMRTGQAANNQYFGSGRLLTQ